MRTFNEKNKTTTCLLSVSHLSIPQYSVSNRLAEQVNEYKKQHGAYSKVPRRLSVHLVTDEQMMLTNPIEDAEDF